MLSNNGLYLHTCSCAVCVTIFSTGGKFRLVSNLTELQYSYSSHPFLCTLVWGGIKMCMTLFRLHCVSVEHWPDKWSSPPWYQCGTSVDAGLYWQWSCGWICGWWYALLCTSRGHVVLSEFVIHSTTYTWYQSFILQNSLSICLWQYLVYWWGDVVLDAIKFDTC